MLQTGDWKTLPGEPDQPKRQNLRDMDDGGYPAKAPPKEHPRVKLKFDKPHSQTAIWSIIPVTRRQTNIT